LGSPLFNRFITTDFSESLLELITLPSKDKGETLIFLDDIHHYVLSIIGDEYLWPLSMPLNVDSSRDIIIAEYGNSNLAMLKRIYREGLAIRYERQMQAISGLHFNYSFSDSYLDSEIFSLKTKSQLSRSEKYLHCSRNILRLNWVILYLYGASPIAPNSLITDNDNDFISLDDGYSYLPHATSLRMSDIGYQSNKQSKLNISYNSLDRYIADLYNATNTFSDDFYNLAKNSKEDLQQLSPNILQIEDEYYSSARPKSSSDSKHRTLMKLKRGGIDYLEFRSLDLNPYCRSGIDIQTIYFLEIFLIYCSILDSPEMTKEESDEVKRNDLIVAKEGRQKNLNLYRNKMRIPLHDWLSQILDEMMVIAETVNSGHSAYIDVIKTAKDRLKFPENTISAMLLESIISDSQSFEEFGFIKGNQHKKDFAKYRNHSIMEIEEEVELSIKKKALIENQDEESFDEFLKNYLKIC
jgi:glutamate--cysteine ligase